MLPGENEEEREKNAINSGPYVRHTTAHGSASISLGQQQQVLQYNYFNI
jgi:hypothetical protein